MLRALLVLVPQVLLASCASAPSPSKSPAPSEVEATLTAFADELVERTELRADVRSIRLQVTPLEVRAARPSRPGELEALAGSLGHDLVLALSRHFHVLDSGVEDTVLPGATHAVTGDLLRLDREVRVTLRLVEVPTGVIVATTEGELLVGELIERGALAWEPRPAAAVAPPESEPEREPLRELVPEAEPAPVSRAVSRAVIEPEPETKPETEPETEPELELRSVAVAESELPPAAQEGFEELPPVRGPASIRRGAWREE